MFTLNKTMTYFTLIFLLVINGLNYASAKKQDSLDVKMEPKSESKVKGEVKIAETEKGVHFSGQLTGLEPDSVHGFHIHEKPDCSAPDGKSAGGHYDPANKPHGGPDEMKAHAGDLGNVKADKNGVVTINKTMKDLTLQKTGKSKKHPIMGRSVVVHKNADDLKSQPSGDAGARIACGEITSKTQ